MLPCGVICSSVSFIPESKGLFWDRYGIKTVAQLYHAGSFKTFADFQHDYNIPNTAYFRRIQIRHMAPAQFELLNVSFQISKLEQSLPQFGHSKLTSTYYPSLLHSRTYRTKFNWRQEYLILQRKCGRKSYPYNALWFYLPEIRPSEQNYSIALIILNIFCKMGKLSSLVCTKFSGTIGSFYYMVYECPLIRAYLSEVTDFTSTISVIHYDIYI